MKLCTCPDKASMHIGTLGSPYEYLCNCCGNTYVDPPPPLEPYPWEKPGHICTHPQPEDSS